MRYLLKNISEYMQSEFLERLRAVLHQEQESIKEVFEQEILFSVKLLHDEWRESRRFCLTN